MQHYQNLVNYAVEDDINEKVVCSFVSKKPQNLWSMIGATIENLLPTKKFHGSLIFKGFPSDITRATTDAK